jgi:multidrug efflux system outer membrane protein
MRYRNRLLLAAAFAAGCAMTPDDRRPPAPVPEAVGDPAAAERAVELPAWGQYFADDTLEHLIARALEHNRDLRIAVARVEEARALYGIQRAERLPAFDAGVQAASSRAPSALADENVIARRYDVNLGLLAYELDFWGRVRNLSRAALASYFSTEAAQRAFRLSLIADVANTYYAVRALDERAALARRTAEARAEALRVIERRLKIGVASRLDMLQARTALEAARADAAALARQAQNARHALTVLVGETVTLPEATGAALEDLPLPPPLPAGLPSSVLLRRPDVVSAEQNLIAANANIAAARAAFFPFVSLVGTVGFASPELNELFDSGRRAWSFVPAISVPIFTGGRLSANLDLAEARQVTAVAQYERTIQLAFAEVADVLSDQAWLAEQHAAQERLVASQLERLRLAQARYDAGLIGYLEVLDAQRETYAAQQDLLEIKRARLAAAAQAYKALGGLGPDYAGLSLSAN